MELKKNPKYDVHRYSTLIFLFSLALSISFVLMAFQINVRIANEEKWKSEEKNESMHHAFSELKSITLPKPNEVAPKSIPPKKIIDPTKIIEVKDVVKSNTSDQPIVEDQLEPLPIFGTETFDLPFEKADSIFIVVEKMPEPIGGFKGFYETINKNIKYPSTAKRNGIQGRVLVEFVVNEDDQLSNFNIISGIGLGCDEEAIRVIGLTKWKAGKQRGHPVKVKMVLPLVYKLN